VRIKAVLLGACFLIVSDLTIGTWEFLFERIHFKTFIWKCLQDFMFFEKAGNNEHDRPGML
jgi:hypothetical protein